MEVSSFQLETIRTFRPSISVWLNFAPDHLDRYRSVAEYRAAKLRIFENQTADDVAVVNAGETLPKIAARTVTFSAYADQADFRLEGGSIVYQNKPVLRMADTKLRGSHNIENLMATLAVGLARGLSFEQMVPPLCAYEPQPHRCEFVREVGGVDLHQRFQGDQSRCGRKALLAQNANRGPDRGRKGQGLHLRNAAAARFAKKSRAVSSDRRDGRAHRAGLERRRAVRDRALAGRRGRARARARASPAKSSSFLPALPPSTCSRATPIAAINFVPWCTPCPNKIMKLPQLLTRKKLRATTARRVARRADEMDYEEMSEPNMKLSRALLIVLVLHVVAVAGIIAFNTIKTRQGPLPPISTAKRQRESRARCLGEIRGSDRGRSRRGVTNRRSRRRRRSQSRKRNARAIPRKAARRTSRRSRTARKPTSSRKGTIRSRSRGNSRFLTTISGRESHRRSAQTADRTETDHSNQSHETKERRLMKYRANTEALAAAALVARTARFLSAACRRRRET